MKIRILSLLILLFCFFSAEADIFVVTTKADAGAGSLRAALSDAASNGVTTTDYINFNLPGNTLADRTIILESQLPNVSGNLILDATTQLGPNLGTSSAKVMIIPNKVNFVLLANGYGCFNIINAIHVEIYGFALDDFFNIRTQTPYSIDACGIYIRSSTEITIGAPGKGNLFIDNTLGINASTELDRITNSKIKIQSNWFGLGVDGNEIGEHQRSLALLYSDDMDFGGTDLSFGNILAGYASFGIEVRGTNVKVNFNRFGYLGDGSLAPRGAVIFMEITNGEFLDNRANRFGIEIRMAKNVKILRNKEADVPEMISNTGIEIIESEDIQIGSDDIADVNVFFDYPIATLQNTSGQRIEVRKNIIHCSPYAYVNIGSGLTIQALVNTDTEFSGTTIPNAEVYIYNDNSDCPSCSPLQFHTQVLADATGKWKITGDFRSNRFVANATLIHTSSDFTQPHFNSFNGRWYRKTDAYCGGANGSVEVANPAHILRVEWYRQSTNEKVGEGFKLEGLPPGSYYALGYNGKCFTKSPYTADIFDETPVFNDQALVIKQPGCGQKNGSIKGLFYTGINTSPSRYEWLDEQNNVLSSTNRDLEGLGPGVYLLRVISGACVRSYGPITLADAGGPGITIDETSAVTSNNTCGRTNGNITGIVVRNALTIQWLNEVNAVVGNNANLLNMPAGKYKLVASSSTCALTSSVFLIENAVSNLNYFPIKQFRDATCNQSNGTISLTFNQTRPKALRWVNATTGADIGNGNSINNLAAGFYKLYLTDENLCETLYETYEIKTIIPPVVNQDAVRVVNDQCGLNLGSISGLSVSGGIVPYRYEWRNQNNEVIGTTVELVKVPAGKYTFHVIDGVNCIGQSSEITIAMEEVALAEPVISPVQICASGVATIAPPPIQVGSYLLYSSATSQTPIAESKDVFQVNVKKSDSYYVSYASGTCQSNRVAVFVLVAESSLSVVNTFSPNNDGVNDIWKIKGLSSYPDFVLKVFNRNGATVFTTRDPDFAFDGTNSGVPLPIGVYYYMLSLRVGCSTLTGSLTLLR